jgi:hypothetical protein
MREFRVDRGGVTALAYLADGRLLAADVGGRVFAFDLATGRRDLLLTADPVRGLHPSPDGRLLTVHTRGLLWWDITIGNAVSPPVGYAGQEADGQFLVDVLTPDGAWAADSASRGDGRKVFIYGGGGTGPVEVSVGSDFSDLCLAPDGRRFAGSILGGDGRPAVGVWTVDPPRLAFSLDG